MKTNICILIFILAFNFANAQTDTTLNNFEYDFIIMDSPAQLFTMRQFNQDYISAYRLMARGLSSVSENTSFSDLVQVILTSFLLMPLTHEEGHRSILTVNNIGSISQPYFNSNGAAYVKGVSDSTLIKLRNSDLPTFIRLHNGGLESDYALTRRIESLGSFEEDEFANYKWEYWMRKLGILQYFVTGLLKFEPEIEEESNELERDIVGYDTYGAARHLFRPEMEFYRYTDYSDLTSQERVFVNMMGFRSLLNLLNPLIIGIENFSVARNLKVNMGMGYSLAPFGDYIDENIWIKFNQYNITFYARQFENRNNWFNGFGLSLTNFKITENISTSIAGHFWQQPEKFDFNSSESFAGGAFDMDIRYYFKAKPGSWLNSYSLGLGMIYKTKGFLPEELYLDEHFGIRVSSSIVFRRSRE